MTFRKCWLLLLLVATFSLLEAQERERRRPRAFLPSPDALWRLLGTPRFKTLQGRLEVTVFTPQGSHTWTMELWADEQRSRTQFTLPHPQGQHQIITVTTPEGIWVWLPFAKRVVRHESSTLPSWRDLWQIRTDKLDMAKNNYTLRLVGKDRIAGHFCLVLQLEPNAKGNALRKIWVHPPTALPLQVERYAPDGQLEMRLTFAEVKINEPLPLLIFDTGVPSDWKEERAPFQRKRIEVSKAAEVLGFVPLLPIWLPPGYAFEGLFLLGDQRWKMAHAVYTDGISVISVFQHMIPRWFAPPPPPSFKGPAPMPPRREHPKGPPKFGAGSLNQVLFPQRMVVRDIGNIRVVLISDVSREWLERMANSLMPAVAAR